METNVNSIKKILVDNDFTKNEVDIYLALLKLGASNAAEVADVIKMDKTSAYRAAKKLLQLGLIVETGDKYNKKLFVDDVNKIRLLVEKKRNTLDESLEEIKNFISALPDFIQSEYLKSKVKVYQGIEGVKKVYEDRLLESIPLIREINTNKIQTYLLPIEHSYWLDHIKKRKEKGIFSHMLVDVSDDSFELHRTNKELFKEVRMAPEDFKITAGINIYGNKVSIHNANAMNIISLVIDDKAISTMMSAFFDFVWKRSKVV